MTTAWGFGTSTGLDFTEGAIVDAHHEACRGTFRALLDEVGIRPGWARLTDPSSPGHPLHQPDAYVSQGAVLAVGTVP